MSSVDIVNIVQLCSDQLTISSFIITCFFTFLSFEVIIASLIFLSVLELVQAPLTCVTTSWLNTRTLFNLFVSMFASAFLDLHFGVFFLGVQGCSRTQFFLFLMVVVH